MTTVNVTGEGESIGRIKGLLTERPVIGSWVVPRPLSQRQRDSPESDNVKARNFGIGLYSGAPLDVDRPSGGKR
jgi:hypothetical protein